MQQDAAASSQAGHSKTHMHLGWRHMFSLIPSSPLFILYWSTQVPSVLVLSTVNHQKSALHWLKAMVVYNFKLFSYHEYISPFSLALCASRMHFLILRNASKL